MVKKLKVEHRSYRNGRARGPELARLHSARTVAKSTTNAKHVVDAKVVLEYREAHLQSESQTDNQIEQSW